MIVMKFGGTSVQDATSMKKVIDIIKDNNKQPLVVMSACSGVTDKLHRIIKSAASDDMMYAAAETSVLEANHKLLITNLLKTKEHIQQASQLTDELFMEIRTLAEGVSLLKECTPKSIDTFLAYGELLSTSIFYCAALENGINASLVDARKVMVTDCNHTNASVNMEKIIQQAGKHILPDIASGKTVITQGFIGSAPDGSTTTIGRGGSDYSAAVFGAALNADEIQIWTDVNGILSTDPRLVPEAVTIPEITFHEVRELSYYGAKVLHPDTIKPAVNRGIPVRVLNTMEPKKNGTLILESINNHKDMVRSLVLKENCIYFKFEIPINEASVSYLPQILDDLKLRNIKVLTIASSENNCIIVLEKTEKTLDSISSLYDKYKLTKKEASLLCLCGTGISLSGTKPPERVLGLTGVLAEFNPIAILYGVSDTSILVIIGREDGLSALKAAHKHFIV